MTRLPKFNALLAEEKEEKITKGSDKFFWHFQMIKLLPVLEARLGKYILPLMEADTLTWLFQQMQQDIVRH